MLLFEERPGRVKQFNPGSSTMEYTTYLEYPHPPVTAPLWLTIFVLQFPTTVHPPRKDLTNRDIDILIFHIALYIFFPHFNIILTIVSPVFTTLIWKRHQANGYSRYQKFPSKVTPTSNNIAIRTEVHTHPWRQRIQFWRSNDYQSGNDVLVATGASLWGGNSHPDRLVRGTTQNCPSKSRVPFHCFWTLGAQLTPFGSMLPSSSHHILGPKGGWG